jgi:hypothetical protein
MASANKFADTGFLIDLFLAGGQKALDALRDKLAGKIIITTETITELGRFTKSDIQPLINWISNPANATKITYTDVELAAARAAKDAAIRAGVNDLSSYELAIQNAQKNAVERAYLELATGKRVTFSGGKVLLGAAVPDAATAMRGITGPNVLLTSDGVFSQWLKNSTTKAAGFAPFGLVDAPVSSSRFFNYSLLGVDDSAATKALIKDANKILKSGNSIGIGLNQQELQLLLTDAAVDASKITGTAAWWKFAAKAGVGFIIAKSGLIGNIIGAVITAAQAEELRDVGKVEDANRLWVKFIFETAGGVGGAVAGAAAVALFLKGKGGLYGVLGTVLGGVAGAILGSLLGAKLGEYIYDNNKDILNSYINKIYDTVDTLSSTLSSFDFDANAVLLAQFLGLGVPPEIGSGQTDLLFATKWAQRIGSDGNDILFGYNADYVPAGGHVFKNDPESEVTPIELRMVLDGGDGNDVIFVAGGERALTVGGLGRDVVANYSKGGEIWGDIANSILDKSSIGATRLRPRPTRTAKSRKYKNSSLIAPIIPTSSGGPRIRPSRIRRSMTF